MTHTKGPWEASSGEVTTPIGDGRSFRRIAVVQDYGMGSLPEVDDANARLIAAAPELLDLLIDSLPYVEEGEEFNKPSSRELSKKIRKLLESLEA